MAQDLEKGAHGQDTQYLYMQKGSSLSYGSLGSASALALKRCSASDLKSVSVTTFLGRSGTRACCFSFFSLLPCIQRFLVHSFKLVNQSVFQVISDLQASHASFVLVAVVSESAWLFVAGQKVCHV